MILVYTVQAWILRIKYQYLTYEIFFLSDFIHQVLIIVISTACGLWPGRRLLYKGSIAVSTNNLLKLKQSYERMDGIRFNIFSHFYLSQHSGLILDSYGSGAHNHSLCNINVSSLWCELHSDFLHIDNHKNAFPSIMWQTEPTLTLISAHLFHILIQQHVYISI